MADSWSKDPGLGLAKPEAIAFVRQNEIFAKELPLTATASNPSKPHRAMQLLSGLPLDTWHTANFRLDVLEGVPRKKAAGDIDEVLITAQAPGASL